MKSLSTSRLSLRFIWQKLRLVLWLMLMPLLLLPVAASASSPAAPLPQASPGDDDEEIVYLGDDGVIRVIDVSPPEGVTPISWFSPIADLDDFALGDFNNDSDFEIAAIERESNRLIIYDPVAATGSQLGLEANGVPWDILYEETLPGEPTVIGAGDMDDGIPGDEILYGYSTGDESSTVRIIKPTSLNPDGRSWQDHIVGNFERDWDSAHIGEISGTGPEEVLLLDSDDDDEDDSSLAVLFNLEEGFGIDPETGDGNEDSGALWDNFSSSDAWLDGAIGQVYEGGPAELAIIRRTDKTSFLLLQYDDGESGDERMDIEEDEDATVYLPTPNSLFLADINGSGDEEVLLLRNTDFEGQARLILQERGGDGTIDIETALDNTNYDTGVGADIDGDDRDEIIIMRDSEIIAFTEADRTLDQRNVYEVSTDGETLEAANLNAIGFQSGPRLATSQESIEAAIPTGTQGERINIALEDAAQNAAVPVSVSVSPNVSWVRVTLASVRTPTTLRVDFDASGLAPGEYTAQASINSTNENVLNAPLVVPITLTVEPASISLESNAVSFVYGACETPEARSRTIRVVGTPDVLYTATLIGTPALDGVQAALEGDIAGASLSADGNAVTLFDGAGNQAQVALANAVERDGAVRAAASNVVWPSSVSWATAESSGRVPDTLTLSVDPAERNSNFEQAVLVVVADSSAGNVPNNVTLVPVYLTCAQSQVYLPLLSDSVTTR